MILNILAHGQPEFQTFFYTIDDGLPSNECHDIVEDQSGYLWIATDRGLSRFDGYGFKNYGISEGLGDLSCLDICIDHEGQIWISTFGRKIYIYNPQTDSITPYIYNDIIDQNNTHDQLLRDIMVDSTGNLYVNIFARGLLKISQEGVLDDRSKNISNEDFFILEENEKAFIGTNGSYAPAKLININGNKILIPEEHNRKYYGDAKVFSLENEQLLIGISGYNLLIQEDHATSKILGDSYQDIIKYENGYLSGQIYNFGLKWHDNVNSTIDQKHQVVLEGVSVSKLLNIGRNVYATTTDQGVIFLKRNNIVSGIFDMLKERKVESISKDSKSGLYAIADRDRLLQLSLSGKILKEIPNNQNEIYSVHYKSDEKQLVIGGNPFSIAQSQTSSNVITYFNYSHNGVRRITAGKKVVGLNNGNTIIIRSDGFAEYNRLDTLPIYDSNNSQRYFRCNIVHKLDNYKYLAGTPNGLFYLDTTGITNLDTIDPLLSKRVNDIRSIDDQLYLGTQGFGLLTYDGSGITGQITTKEGLVSDNIECLHVIDNTTLAVGTYAGLSIIDLSSDSNTTIRNFTVHHGLPANDIYDLTSIGDTLLIGTGKGLALLTQQSLAEIHPKPMIEEIEVNGKLRQSDMDSLFHLNPKQKNITIHYRSLDLSMRGDILYQISLNDTPWTTTKNTSINYASLSPGKYLFKVRSANRDGAWGDTRSLNFTIEKPWWATYWFYILCTLSAILVVYQYNRNRIRNIQRENDIQNEIIKLEKSALQAQMNPHFIFNCLNSIQHFIMKNDKEHAMDYLSRFAQLVRQTLNASVDSLVSIDQEVSMLSNYLELEKIRFNGRFNYSIIVDPKINRFKTHIPPLLIQPYVENAIIHGVGGDTKDGMITIDIQQSNEQLKVTIHDNGKGISTTNDQTHKSLGTSITQKRLSYIYHNTGDKYQVTPTTNSTGTQVQILIKI